MIFQLGLNIADIRINLSSNKKRFIEKLRSKYRSFLNQDNLNNCIEVLLLHQRKTGNSVDPCLIRQEDRYHINSSIFSAQISLKDRFAKVEMPARIDIFESFLRIIYSILLLSEKGFLVHSVGLEDRGKGYLFPGSSSSGKTTLARENKDCRLLSDELVAVRRIKDRFYLFATPFIGGYQAVNISAPLERVFFLNKDLLSLYQEQAQLETMLNLLKNTFFYARDSQSNQEILELCTQVSSQVRSYQVNPGLSVEGVRSRIRRFKSSPINQNIRRLIND